MNLAKFEKSLNSLSEQYARCKSIEYSLQILESLYEKKLMSGDEFKTKMTQLWVEASYIVIG